MSEKVQEPQSRFGRISDLDESDLFPMLNYWL